MKRFVDLSDWLYYGLVLVFIAVVSISCFNYAWVEAPDIPSWIIFNILGVMFGVMDYYWIAEAAKKVRNK